MLKKLCSNPATLEKLCELPVLRPCFSEKPPHSLIIFDPVTIPAALHNNFCPANQQLRLKFKHASELTSKILWGGSFKQLRELKEDGIKADGSILDSSRIVVLVDAGQPHPRSRLKSLFDLIAPMARLNKELCDIFPKSRQNVSFLTFSGAGGDNHSDLKSLIDAQRSRLTARSYRKMDLFELFEVDGEIIDELAVAKFTLKCREGCEIIKPEHLNQFLRFLTEMKFNHEDGFLNYLLQREGLGGLETYFIDRTLDRYSSIDEKIDCFNLIIERRPEAFERREGPWVDPPVEE